IAGAVLPSKCRLFESPWPPGRDTSSYVDSRVEAAGIAQNFTQTASWTVLGGVVRRRFPPPEKSERTRGNYVASTLNEIRYCVLESRHRTVGLVACDLPSRALGPPGAMHVGFYFLFCCYFPNLQGFLYFNPAAAQLGYVLNPSTFAPRVGRSPVLAHSTRPTLRCGVSFCKALTVPPKSARWSCGPQILKIVFIASGTCLLEPQTPMTPTKCKSSRPNCERSCMSRSLT